MSEDNYVTFPLIASTRPRQFNFAKDQDFVEGEVLEVKDE
jgi:hypothetical protein